jgi:hypothetical protein
VRPETTKLLEVNLWETFQYIDVVMILEKTPKHRQQKQKGTNKIMFIAALFTIAKLWKQPRCPTTDEWIKKMWHLYTMEFYAAMRKNEMLSFTGKRMEL